MKKIAIILGMLILFFTCQGWADTIDEVTVTEEAPYIVEINGTYSDGCDRDPVLLTTYLDNTIIIQIFTVPPAGDCPDGEENVFDFSLEIVPPGDDYQINVIMYRGTPRADEDVEVIDSETLEVQSDIEELEATVDINPDTINIKRKGQYINARITLSGGEHDVSDIDAETILLAIITDGEESGTVVSAQKVAVDEDEDNILIVKFDNDEVLTLIEEEVDVFPQYVIFVVKGALEDGSLFSGTDDVKVMNPGKSKSI